MKINVKTILYHSNLVEWFKYLILLLSTLKTDMSENELLMVGQQNQTCFKFHPYHGEHIDLSENNSVAYRTEGFDDGVVFSEKQLLPGEIFVIEIEQNQSRRRASYLRLGLTQLNPAVCASRKIELPKQAVPDLIMRLEESSWIYAVDDLLPRKREIPWPFVKGEYNVDISDQYIETCRGRYLRSSLRSTPFIKNVPKTMRNIEVGYKIGVVYIPRNDEIADLFFVFNGDLFGPYALEIPYKETPLYAAVDVYGRTQKVRILQIHAEPSLKHLCRMTIRKMYDMKTFNNYSLPKQIKNYLNSYWML